ncbi:MULTISPECIES: cupin domain-containing protein [unclassified Sporosarcina]|uniref:cupin domain-containing protein n=1 Tax=unclassified Sporosarcina TaxID=2647733 RepID=UPI00203EB568|nr:MULTISPECIES: cupin domain-containing protein [unclassified Sporosarcina]GKV66945.1 cupin [Sporosarcina sp. NCCP-2331]GLB57298.1 cupin [Sporosarcina sp. NCCP-2378]
MVKEIFSRKEIEKRVIRKADLVADKAAFIDAKTPGSDKKENYCIIGPGVSESGTAVINLKEPHGFNVGAAAMPNGCVNSLHLHQTAEVFIVARGTWRFIWGNDGTDGEAVLNEGDVISLPTHIFRGFKNIGSDDGFLFSVLGEDDPQSVTWGPQVLRDAEGHGLVLLEDGRLIDTSKGMEIPKDVGVIKPTPQEELNKLRKVTQEEMEARVFWFKDRTPYEDAFLDSRSEGGKKYSYGIIGPGIADDVNRPSIVNNEHSFSLELIEAEPGNGLNAYSQSTPQVLIVYKGEWKVTVGLEDGKEFEVVLTEKDTFSVPKDHVRSIKNAGNETGFIYVISGGDEWVSLDWSDEVIEEAKKYNLFKDAEGKLVKK